MHRYIPRLHIIQAFDDYTIQTGPSSTFIFEETAFIAVTAYQNDQVEFFVSNFYIHINYICLDKKFKN